MPSHGRALLDCVCVSFSAVGIFLFTTTDDCANQVKRIDSRKGGERIAINFGLRYFSLMHNNRQAPWVKVLFLYLFLYVKQMFWYLLLFILYFTFLFEQVLMG